jgi:hypothetical protein
MTRAVRLWKMCAMDVKGAKALVSRLAAANVGDRVRLISTSRDYGALAPGVEGTVALIDNQGAIHVQWDSGEEFALVVGQDFWRALRTVA